jgi:hypothetical protein
MGGILWIALHGMAYERVHIDMLVETDLFGLKQRDIRRLKMGSFFLLGASKMFQPITGLFHGVDEKTEID